MLDTLQQNRVTKTCNYTLMNMVRSMLSYSSSPLSLWMHALKTAMYIFIE